ncbi:PBP1A family penicillin-binding protein [Cohnella pontilimi]|uniref:PBP1A family penicillin-binding protein n=1 Tax=Cohnella pontilimi TaxID=2564100 RepID=A0A4U0FGK2_9BACL|nr:PBP1A family penicillin-binding protein [Cohnella pontilimi]TJY44028.1 PBP1A family penicillin-binding protein [Cohnella pontilimi]
MSRPKSFQWTGEPLARAATEPPERHETPDPPAPQKKRRIPRLRIRHLVVGLLLLLLIDAAVIGLWIMSLDIDRLAIPTASPTQLMDIHNKPVSEISSVKYEPVPLDQIPKSMREAIIAVEDRRFYDHQGIDVPGIIRAAFANAKQNAAVQGGSTITQQLAKNVFLSDTKTFTRKLTEAAYAFKIEAAYSKDRILEMYLNQIYFGEGQWGIQRAAKRYFGKNAKELTLAESAMLAALPKAPSRYSPFRNKELAIERRDLVLGLMRKEGFITDNEFIQAKAEPVRLADPRAKSGGIQGKYGSYADAVIDEAIQKYGFTERQLMAGNLRIYTTMNPKVQEAMEAAYRNDGLFPPSAPDQLVQSGAVILDPYTGGIRGLVGQRGEHTFRGFNHATQLQRQPGSAFKPVMVYAPAIQRGYQAGSLLYDGPLDIGGYRPENADHQYRGQVTLHDALVHSWNIPAVWLLNEIGVSTGKAFVSKLGIPLTQEDTNLGMALGGLSKGVSPVQMAQSFSVFPALGKVTPAHTILKITTADGKVLAKADPQSVTVMTQQDAYQMTELLQDVVREGTGKRAALQRPTAGKTGTTQLPPLKEFEGIDGGSKDVWFVGYTPQLVGAVWMGYDATDSKHYLSTSGGQYPALVFKEMMTLALKDEPISNFKQPPGAGGTKPEGKPKDNKQEENSKINEKGQGNGRKNEDQPKHDKKKKEKKVKKHKD